MKITFLILFLFVASSFQEPAYDPKLSQELWRASSAAYLEKDKLKHMDCGAACSDLKGYQFSHQFTSPISKDESVSYSVFYNKEQHKAIFAFRGTAGGKQLTKEILDGGAKTYDMHNVPNALATDYFYKGYKNHLRDDVIKQTKAVKAACPTCDFYFTGHSLGGALTTLGALDVSMSKIVDKKKLNLYTYGSPRVGDVNLAQAVSNHVHSNYRVVHNKDTVPHVPPCINGFNGECLPWKNHMNENGLPIWNAYHTGTEVFYHDSKNPYKYKLCKKPEDPTCSKKFALVHTSLDDHDKYMGLGTNVHSKLPHHHATHGHQSHGHNLHHNNSHIHHPIHHPTHHNNHSHIHHPIHHPTHHNNHSHLHHGPHHPIHHNNHTHRPIHHPIHHNNHTHKPIHPGHHTIHHNNHTHKPGHHTIQPGHHTIHQNHTHKPSHHTIQPGHHTIHQNHTHHPTHPGHHTVQPGHHTIHPTHPTHPGHHTVQPGHHTTHPTHHNQSHHHVTHPTTHHPSSGTHHPTTPVHHPTTPVHHPTVHHPTTPVHHPTAHHPTTPAHHNPAPVHHTPVHHTPVHHPAPVHHTPVHHTPVHHPAPVHHTPVHHPAPVHHTPVHHPAPVHHAPAPVHHAPAPVHHPTPVHHPAPPQPKPQPKPAPTPTHRPTPVHRTH